MTSLHRGRPAHGDHKTRADRSLRERLAAAWAAFVAPAAGQARAWEPDAPARDLSHHAGTVVEPTAAASVPDPDVMGGGVTVVTASPSVDATETPETSVELVAPEFPPALDAAPAAAIPVPLGRFPWWPAFTSDGPQGEDVVRVGADVMSPDLAGAAEVARSEVIDWMHARCGVPLSDEARLHLDLLVEGGGARGACLTVRTASGSTWAARLEHGHAVTEVVVCEREGWAPTFAVREASTAHAPGPVRTPVIFLRVAGRIRLRMEDADVEVRPWHVDSDAVAAELCDILLDPQRARPVFLLSVPPDADRPLVDADALAAATCGNAVVAVVPDTLTWALTDRLGSGKGAFDGAVRTYMPGFAPADPNHLHPFLKRELISVPAERERWIAGSVRLAAETSLSRLRVGPDVRSFASVEAALMRAQAAERLASRPVDATDAPAPEPALAGTVAALEARAASLAEAKAKADEDARVALALASGTEAELLTARTEVSRLGALLRDRGARPWEVAPPPADWASMAAWVDEHLAGLVSLAPLARRNAKGAVYEDVGAVHRALLWLAARTSSELAGGSLNDVMIESGIKNSRCGSESFAFETGAGTRQVADWHVKSMGRTFDQRRCLRIYYAWDAAQRHVVIADWPAHRPCQF